MKIIRNIIKRTFQKLNDKQRIDELEEENRQLVSQLVFYMLKYEDILKTLEKHAEIGTVIDKKMVN